MKTKEILISTIILLFGGGAIWYYFKQKQETSSPTTTDIAPTNTTTTEQSSPTDATKTAQQLAVEAINELKDKAQAQLDAMTATKNETVQLQVALGGKTPEQKLAEAQPLSDRIKTDMHNIARYKTASSKANAQRDIDAVTLQLKGMGFLVLQNGDIQPI